MAQKTKLTVAVVKAVEPGPRDIIVWDTELTGLHLKVTPTGKRGFFLFYRSAEGRQCRPMLGDFPALKPEAARALGLLSLIHISEPTRPY